MRAIVSLVDPCGVAFHVAIESGAHSKLDVVANLPLSSNVPSACRQGRVQ